jgi:hypothetical protein
MPMEVVLQDALLAATSQIAHVLASFTTLSTVSRLQEASYGYAHRDCSILDEEQLTELQGVDCVAYSDTNCQNQVADSGNSRGTKCMTDLGSTKSMRC